jgi:predicted HTH transcriptional regulator
MFPFPKLDDCTHFPLPEGTNLEFKQGFNSSMAEKIYATICGILNSGGGYLVIGVEDATRLIRGIRTDKTMDHFLITLDNIYHHGHIRTSDGKTIPLGTVSSGIVQAAEGKELLVVTITAAEGEKYTVKDGSVWYRLSASNFKKTCLPMGYSEKELKYHLESQAQTLQQQFSIEKRILNKKIGMLQQNREELKVKFRNLEGDFERVMRAAKATEEAMGGFRDLLYQHIEREREEVEAAIEGGGGSKGWLSYLCCL